MSIIETVLVFVGIPAAIIAFLTLCVYGKSLMHQPNRYRPGRDWDFAPSWFVAHPETLAHAGHAAVTAGPTTAVGGASGEW